MKCQISSLVNERLEGRKRHAMRYYLEGTPHLRAVSVSCLTEGVDG